MIFIIIYNIILMVDLKQKNSNKKINHNSLWLTWTQLKPEVSCISVKTRSSSIKSLAIR